MRERVYALFFNLRINRGVGGYDGEVALTVKLWSRSLNGAPALLLNMEYNMAPKHCTGLKECSTL